MHLRTILCPVSLPTPCESAMQFAAALARDHDARLILLHVFRPPRTPDEVAERDRAARLTSEFVERFQDLLPDDRTIALEHRAIEGAPADEICRMADETGCDLIVLGTHGRRGLRRKLLGSVAEEVVRRAMCPVASVRQPVHVLESPVGTVGELGDTELGTGD